MKFLYLLQGKADNVRRYHFLKSDRSDLMGLSYDQPEEGFTFLPKSTFASGRNFLFEQAIERLHDFDYFIFLDDDVEFCRGSFIKMEDNLTRFKPRIGVPLTEKTRLTAIGVELKGNIIPLVKAQKRHINDEQYLALSRDVLKDGLLLPYLTQWDLQSWFVCCLIQEALIQHYYFGKAYQFNDCEISNLQHSGSYPHNLELAQSEYRMWMKKNFPQGTKRPATYQCTLQIQKSIPGTLSSFFTALVAASKMSALYRGLRGHQKW
jgi:hypothetical protein